MASAQVLQIKGQPWNPDVPAIMVVQTRPAYIPEKRLDISVDLTLRRHAIKRGWFRKTECYIACTGAHVRVWAKLEDFKFFDFTPTGWVKVDTEIKEVNNAGVEINPEIEVKAKGADLSAKVFKVERSRGREEVAKLTVSEAPLVASHPTDNVVEWSLDKPQVKSVVRDFLQGTMGLQAKGKWAGNPPTVQVLAEPRDLRVFGPDLRELGILWSIALMAKLNSRGELPSANHVEQEIKIS